MAATVLMLPCLVWSATMTLEAADITITVAGTTRETQRGALPFPWDKRVGEVDGQARFVMRIPVDNTLQPLGIYLPRIGNTFVATVNGRELTRYGTLPPNRYDDASTRPRFFTVPAEWLTPETTLELAIATIGGHWGGLSTVTVGPADEVYPQFALENFIEVDIRLALVVVATMFGLFGLLLWARQRDTSYLYYAGAELLWALVIAWPLFLTPPLPSPFWWQAYQAIFALAVPMQCKFALRVIDRDNGRIGRLNNFLLVMAVPVVVLLNYAGISQLSALGRSLTALNIFATAWILVTHLTRHSKPEQKILGVAVTMVVIAGLRDHLVLSYLANAYPGGSWVRYAWSAFGISFAWTIAERLRRTDIALATANATLSQQLSARNAELTTAFARERVKDVERGGMLERQRLMRDLHDGLGSHLVGALHAAQQPWASKEDITSQLRMAVDQLKITVDAMQEVDGDIPSLLGAIRHRLTPRLQAAQLTLNWDVAHLPQLAHWGVRQSYDLQMIIFEAFSNLVVHSGADSVTLSARQKTQTEGAEIEIEICDNGKGFPKDVVESTTGKGLASIRARAERIGAELNIHTGPDGTRILLALFAAKRKQCVNELS